MCCPQFWYDQRPSTFVTFMNKVFKEHIRKQAIIYLDNIIIYSPNLKQHWEDVCLVLCTLKENHCIAKPSKCDFLSELPFFGHIISKDRIKPDPENIHTITDMPAPRNKSELHKFLGMVAYIRRFIPDWGALSAP